MEMKEKLIRSCTLDVNVQDLLLEYLKDNNVEELENLLKEGQVEVNYIYEDESEYVYNNRNALQIACAEFANEISEKCIQLLLKYGADIFYVDPVTERTAFHFAAESGNCKILKTILRYIKRKQLDINNSDIIYTLIKYTYDSDTPEEKYVPILKLLLKTDIDVNYQDIESGWTPIFMAATYEYKQFVQLIIDNKKTEINLDEFKYKGKSARDLIINKELYKGELPEYTEENSNVTIFTLFKHIRNRLVEMDDFIRDFETIENNLSKKEKYLLLDMAVKYRLEKIVKMLLEKGVNFEISYSNNQENPMILAAQRGYFKIIHLFLRTKPNGELVSQSIFELLKISYTAEQSENVNYFKCLTLLLKSENLDINAKDYYNDNTALHYALRYQEPEMALLILRKGAKLGCKDSYSRPAIADMDSITLETHLNSCIRYENEEISTGDDARLIIDFTSLLPIENNKIQFENGPEKVAVDVESESATDIKNEIFVPETEVLQYMCTSQELKQHLKHPVILAFLFLKWHRIAKFFYINLSLYILFVLSLLIYITFSYNIKDGTNYQFITTLSYGVLTFTFILLVIREVAQIILYKHTYFYAFENWLEIILLIATAGILSEKTEDPLMRQFSAIAIVAAAIEFLLLVGQFPAMSTNIMMLRTVSYTFFKLLLWYSILLFAFSYSFYTLFQERGEEANTNSTVVGNGEDEEQDFFEDPGMSLLKTIVMLTGEFDAASIKFDHFPVISHLIFVMFVFLITIVLFNLLNGLAVSDTQIIKNDAELYGQILRVEHIAHIESVLLRNKLLQRLPMIKKICLFPLKTKKGEALVYPNQNAKVDLLQTVDNTNDINNAKSKSSANCFKVFFGIYFDKKIQREIRSLMKQMKEDTNKKKKEDQLLAEIENLRNLIQSFIKKDSI